MVWVKVIGIVVVGKAGVVALKDYEGEKKQGLERIFDGKEVGMKKGDLWEKE